MPDVPRPAASTGGAVAALARRRSGAALTTGVRAAPAQVSGRRMLNSAAHAEAEGTAAEGSGASSAPPVPEMSCSSAAAASSVHAEA